MVAKETRRWALHTLSGYPKDWIHKYFLPFINGGYCTVIKSGSQNGKIARIVNNSWNNGQMAQIQMLDGIVRSYLFHHLDLMDDSAVASETKDAFREMEARLNDKDDLGVDGTKLLTNNDVVRILKAMHKSTQDELVKINAKVEGAEYSPRSSLLMT
jgi:hypothetical protein